MKQINLEDIPTTEFGVHSIRAHEATWQKKDENPTQFEDIVAPYNSFVLILTGSIVYTQRNGDVLCASIGDILYLPPEVHFSLNFRILPVKLVFVNFVLLDEHSEPMRFANKIFKIKQNARNMFEEDFMELIDICSGTNQLKIKLSFFDLLSAIIHVEISEGTNLIDPALRFIDTHLNENIKIRVLAKMCALNESAFRKEFKKRMGIGCKQYINYKKIQAVKHMLHEGQFMAKDISEALGFYDESHCRKMFQTVTGMTLGQYQQEFDMK